MTPLEEANKRLWRLIHTSLSKKIVAATIICWMTYDLINKGKFGTDWMGPAGAFAACLTFVGHVFNIDLDTKKIFPDAAGLTNKEPTDGDLYT